MTSDFVPTTTSSSRLPSFPVRVQARTRLLCSFLAARAPAASRGRSFPTCPPYLRYEGRCGTARLPTSSGVPSIVGNTLSAQFCLLPIHSPSCCPCFTAVHLPRMLPVPR
ncbi:hypothetical protein BDW02DRAFT_414750 [Decorospora gaudefroyi]|uniref:Uncharacterized protein n=1 Tax=Decorospora gaudefroyi TaxID=184978 RepID=A0A6A5KV52_9PLEO|nr:hypothetical protein BDW02DRAFT_414750 [Decorospora gaudefroyi]